MALSHAIILALRRPGYSAKHRGGGSGLMQEKDCAATGLHPNSTLVRPTSGIDKWPKLSGNSLPDALAKHAGPAEGQFGPSTPDSN
jgi:hypothetical protein